MKQQELLPMPCHTWAEKLAAVHPDDLTGEERAALEQHVQSCDACAAALAEYRHMDAAILALPPVEPLPALPLALQQVFGEEETHDSQLQSLPPSRIRSFRPSLPHIRPRTKRWIRLASAVAAVLVVAALIGSLAVLFRATHTLVGGAGAGQVIYVASRNGTVYAIRPSDGAIYWQYKIGQKLNGDLAASSSAVYAIAGSHVYALRKSDGALLWTSPAVPGGTFPPTLTDGNAVYLSSSSSLFALSTRDGHILWSSAIQLCSNRCLAVPVAVSGGIVYAFEGQLGDLFALSTSDGHVIWRGPTYQLNSFQFAMSEGRIFVPDARHGKLYELSASDGNLLYTFSFFQHDQPIELLAAGGVVYVDNVNFLCAIRASDGVVLWQNNARIPPNDSPILGLSAAGDGALYFASAVATSGSIQIVSSSGSPTTDSSPTVTWTASTDVSALNTSDGNLRWQWQRQLASNTASVSNVLALNSNVYLSIGGSLYALSSRDGRQIWVVNLHTTSLTSPVAG